MVGLAKASREERGKRRKAGGEIGNVALTFNSGPAAIAYWINSYLKSADTGKICEDHEVVGKIKAWLDEQMEQGRFGEVPDSEMLEQVNELLPNYLPAFGEQ